MSAQHTPGPWVHHPEDNIITTPNGFCKLLEWQARSMHVPQAERDANARLIAAAPELLEALRITRGNVASLGPAGALEPYAPYREWLAMIDAAIEKATGEQT